MEARPMTRNEEFDDLLRSHYGLPRPRRSGPAPAHTARLGAGGVALAADTGNEVLVPAPAEPTVEDYVVDRPEPPELTGGTEPVPAPEPGPPVVATPSPPPAAPPSPYQEPPGVEQSAAYHPGADPQRTPAPSTGTPAPPALAPTPPAALPPADVPAVPDQPDQPQDRTPVGEDTLAADMQAILSGRKVFNPETGNLHDRGPGGPTPPPAPPERPVPEARDDQSIFDRIAASLEHSNSFNLGDVELQRRFEDFNHTDDRKRSGTGSRNGSGTVPAPKPLPGPHRSFVEDLDAIERERSATQVPVEDPRTAYHREGPWSGLPGRDAACGASSLALTVAPDRSVAMYDTGEHVLAAGDLYPDRLTVGSGAGVTFSYGQIVAMPDFFESVDQMQAASPTELARLKTLIQRNTDYYRNNRQDPSGNIGNTEWDDATGGRYLRLAETNYDHFAPAALLGMSGGGRESNNRSRWEELHTRAIHEQQQLVLAHPNATPFPAGPLTTNAFADHFLTDAFASGHLVNKEVVIERFRANFFSGSTLNEAGREFFGNVADRAYTGEVARRFSQLQSTAPLCQGGFCVNLHPNIRFAWMFAEVLRQAAEAEPVKIANLAVKVVHDKLNHDGVRVVNDAGDPEWTLTGDGAMNSDSMPIMRRAVQQSVDNINDPAILVSNINIGPFLERVWRHTPRPTPAGAAQVNRVVETFTNPRSAELVTATADLITEQLDSLIKALVDSGRMEEDR